MVQRKTLSPRDKRFVAEYVKNGKNGTQAVLSADPSLKKSSASVQSSRMLNNVNIQLAISEALELHGATPEFAIGRLKTIAEQNEELGASRLASKDILELHGWSKTEKPVIAIQVNEFFSGGRDRQVVEGETKD